MSKDTTVAILTLAGILFGFPLLAFLIMSAIGLAVKLFF